METTFISKCCREEATEDYKPHPKDKYEDIDIWVCSKCKKECEVEVCADCLGTGEVTTMEAVYAGEPHIAPIGTRTCHCQAKEEEYDDQE